MTTETDLAQQTCEPCQGIGGTLNRETATARMSILHDDWTLNAEATEISRTFRFKGFAKAVYTANLAAFLADKEGHHPDVSFGWGYCTISYTSHELGGLTVNDFICAAKLDKMVD
ncbi:4a-hydroxytetrahydrobiopterin dehydratase [Roseibium sp.]|uniref:4a-hydroxytetrahydrobiopterin dehydratase n=1 Tax=Roseibium sp. TaxID=1936156 RepID=UPI003A975B98